MATNTANLQDAATSVTTGFESIVIVDNFKSLRGGRTLDTAAFASANPLVLILMAGHVIIRETATGTYRPMPIASAAQPYTGVAYGALTAGHTYAGYLINTILVAKPFAGIMVEGTINPLAEPYTISGIAAAILTAVPLVEHRSDNF